MMRLMNEGKGGKINRINYLDTFNAFLNSFGNFISKNPSLLKNLRITIHRNVLDDGENKVEKLLNKFYPKINYDILDVK